MEGSGLLELFCVTQTNSSAPQPFPSYGAGNGGIVGGLGAPPAAGPGAYSLAASAAATENLARRLLAERRLMAGAPPPPGKVMEVVINFVMQYDVVKLSNTKAYQFQVDVIKAVAAALSLANSQVRHAEHACGQTESRLRPPRMPRQACMQQLRQMHIWHSFRVQANSRWHGIHPCMHTTKA